MAASESLPAWKMADIEAMVEPAVVAAVHSAVLGQAQEIARAFRGRIAGLPAAEFGLLMGSYQDCVRDLQRITGYAELAVASGSLAAKGGAALSRCDLAWSELATVLSFVEPELAALSAGSVSNQPMLAAGGQLHNFHQLLLATSGKDDKVAAVLTAMEPSGIAGWQALARQLLGRINLPGSDGAVSIGSALPKFYRAPRPVRVRLQQQVTAALATELELRATALSMIVQDGLARAELTNGSWLDEVLASDQLSQAELDALVAGATAGYPLIHRYYELKASLLGRDQLDEADRYAPISEDSGQISWSQASQIVLATFTELHPACGQAARELLAAGRVDAANRPGKAATPFTKDVPGERPWISVNFDGSLRHVLLLAHELGHGVHMMMAGQLPLLAATTPRVLAETVALFFESATLARIERTQEFSSAMQSLLGRWIEDQAVTICRHAAIFRFEVGLRDRMRAGGYLDAELINALWLNSQRELYGPGVALSADFGGWWSYLDGIYQAPGSSYAHLYGQFAAAALVDRQARSGEEFGEQLLALMAAGGSAPPRELLRRAGVDPLHPATWQAALHVLGERVRTLQLIAAGPAPASQSFGGFEPRGIPVATHPVGG